MSTQQRLDEPIDISLTGEMVDAVECPFDFDKENKTWKKYNITDAPLLLRSEDGSLYDDGKWKGIFKWRKVTEGKKLKWKRDLRTLASRKYVVFPNEECDVVVNKMIENDRDFGLKLNHVHTAYNGDAKYWEITSNRKYKIDSGDEVLLGIVVRNSLARNVAFGADVSTFRLICANGAISKGKDLMSLKIPHYGKGALVLMHEALSRRIADLFIEGEELIRQYKIATKLKVRQEAAELLVKKVSHRYLPEYIEINEKTHDVKLTKSNVSFWKLFNFVTEEVWHNNALSFLTKADITNVMHYVMKNEIAVAAK